MGERNTYIHCQTAHAQGGNSGPGVAYGANLPDMCNLVMTEQGQTLAYLMHNTIPEVDTRRVDCDARAILYGIIIHGPVYGADYTAHIHAIPSPTPSPSDTGYFVQKGYQLAGAGLGGEVYNILVAAGLPADYPNLSDYAAGIAVELGHDLAETAVDLLVTGDLDSGIGPVMIAASQGRPNDVPKLIASVYKQNPGFVKQCESAWRQQMQDYGGVMTLPRADAIQLLAEQQAPVAEMYIDAMLAQMGINVSVSVTPTLVATYIYAALDVVKDDYKGEINKTVLFIKGNPIPYGPMFATRDSRECEHFGRTNNRFESVRDRREFPNPFNPTTISGTVCPKPRTSRLPYTMHWASRLLNWSMATLTLGHIPSSLMEAD